ncbi:MH2 domain-containing protein [Aphelenchoides fujianensis]|nr:MH2 domain-containing protein [Aphelenchoides fujianensis]
MHPNVPVVYPTHHHHMPNLMLNHIHATPGAGPNGQPSFRIEPPRPLPFPQGYRNPAHALVPTMQNGQLQFLRPIQFNPPPAQQQPAAADERPRPFQSKKPPPKLPNNFKSSRLSNPKAAEVLKADENQVKPDEPAAFWCQIYFYQFTHRMESFKGNGREVRIDGLCAPSDSSRFCLGIKGSIVMNATVETARRQIGDGCRMFMDGENIHLECLSDSPIFVQCPLYASIADDHLSTVYRLAKAQSLQIFNPKRFAEMIKGYAHRPYAYMFSLRNMCYLRVSFVKGWGECYRRRTITATPCWVEIYLTHALEQLDNALLQLPEANGLSKFRARP